MPLLYGDPTTATAYTCPMHPDVISDAPGTCPIAGMKLIPAPPPTIRRARCTPTSSTAPGTCPHAG